MMDKSETCDDCMQLLKWTKDANHLWDDYEAGYHICAKGEHADPLTLDEWVESHKALKDLDENLRTNLSIYTDLSAEDTANLTRVNMRMIRQCIEELVK
jgi:carbonic anhydrase